MATPRQNPNGPKHKRYSVPFKTIYSEEVAEEILERLQYPETLAHICKYDRDGNERAPNTFPNHFTVYDWGNPKCAWHVPDFVPRLGHAKLNQQWALLDQTIDIVDQPFASIDEIAEVAAKTGLSPKEIRKDMVAHRALQVDARLKALKMMDPEKWGDRIKHGVTESLAALIEKSMEPRE